MAATEVHGPGKTAPKLLADFLQFDPQKNNVGGNILTNHPPPVGDGPPPSPHKDACKHEYTVKTNQSVTPPLDSRPDASSQYKLAVVCKRCRLHADIRVSYQQSTDPCPNSDNPLHHFQRASVLDETSSTHIRFGWQCSSSTCQALLTTTFKLPKIGNVEKNLLTDTSKLRDRFDAVMQEDPEREGIRLATPVDALTRLRKYIRDALNPQHDKRVFPANNKRFMEAYGLYGRDCRQMLETLGFRYNEEAMNWTLPNPPQIEDPLGSDGDRLRESLEDWEMELLALAWRTAAEMNTVNPAAGEGWSSAQRDLERVLGSQGYQRLTSLRRTNAPNENEAYFASLGALSDFPDGLVEFAYERQTQCDVLSEPYYFECIQVIARQRGSEDLQLKMTMLESKGLVSRRDLSEAYRYFDLPADGRQVEDQRIHDIFKAREPDLGVQAQERAREMLGRIGRQRGSKLLTNAAMQTIETAEEAYAWLGSGLGPESDDGFVVTFFAMKTDGNKDLEEIGRKAVSIIARERKSTYLNNWLAGDESVAATMGVDEALRLLGVETSLESIDKTLWQQIFQGARDGKPGEQTEQAIAAVQKALDGETAGDITMRSPETWPVGLVSHGNTCYLNSLLQYYFSLKPLRDIVTEYEQYAMDTKKNQDKLERVGQRRVSTQEIEGGQKFADELRHLFERMIKDRGPAVKPEQDLVCRAFLDPKDFAEHDKQRNAKNSAIDDDPTMPDLIPNGVDEQKDSDMGQSRASSETLQAEEIFQNGQAEDVKMNGSEMPLTPPTSPGQKPADQKTDGPAPPPLPARRFSTTTSDTLAQAQAKATEQQDVTEVHDSITQRLRAGMQPKGADNRGEQNDALRDLFAIGMAQTTLSSTSIGKPELIFDSSIQLNVPLEPTDLYSALNEYFDPQLVTEGSEKQQYRSIVKLPPLIQINMPRIGFDKIKGTYKSDKSMRLEDELYLDRYFDSPDTDVLKRRRAAWDRRSKLAELKKEQKALKGTNIGLDGPAAVSETAKFIQALEDVNADLQSIDEEPVQSDPEIHTALEADAAHQAERLQSLDREVNALHDKLTGTFDDLRDKKYRLYAVFFHRGGHNSGHYWVSIHDFKNDVWRSYNDETVKEVPSSEVHKILHAHDWPDGNPTFAVYVRDDLKDKYVEAVCRDPEPAPPSLWPDVNMTDAPAQARTGITNPPAQVTEGGDGAWDEPRAVPDIKCESPGLTESDGSKNDSLDMEPDVIDVLATTEPEILDAILTIATGGGSSSGFNADLTAQLGIIQPISQVTNGAQDNQGMPGLTRTPTRTRPATSPERKRIASRPTGAESPTKRQDMSPVVEEMELSQKQLDNWRQEDWGECGSWKGHPSLCSL